MHLEALQGIKKNWWDNSTWKRQKLHRKEKHLQKNMATYIISENEQIIISCSASDVSGIKEVSFIVNNETSYLHTRFVLRLNDCMYK